MKTGIKLITEERERQILTEGWTAAHDKQHNLGELAFAAAVYATPSLLYKKKDYANQTEYLVANMAHWNLKVPRKGNVIQDNNSLATEDRIKQLTKAGALIAAEIDRLLAKS